MSTYKDAGVDIDAGDRAVELMKASIAKASRPEVMGSIGGFAGFGIRCVGAVVDAPASPDATAPTTHALGRHRHCRRLG